MSRGPSYPTPRELAPVLTGFLLRAFPEQQHRTVNHLEVRDLRLLTGGASRQSWAFDVWYETAQGRTESLPLILRGDAQQGPQGFMERSLEYRVIAAAHAEGVLAPRPYFVGDGSLGMPFFIMERMSGETLPRRLFRDAQYARARGVMAAELGTILARIHRVSIDKHGLHELPAPRGGDTAAEAELARYMEKYRRMAREPHPVFELAFRWLAHHLPQERERVFVHGDYRMGNIMFGPDGVRSILDWELAHIGDPMEDLSWMCVRSWRFGNDRLPVGGVGTRRAFQHAYEQAGGCRLDQQRLRFWEIFGNLRWGVICLNMTQPYLDGISPSVELAAIGRRTAETEWELLHLMED